MRVEHIGRATQQITAIYALCEFPSWRPRYIGKTVQYLHQRHKAHIRDARRGGKRPVNYWLRKQIASGQRLAIKLLEYVPAGEDWSARERHWIAAYRAEHADLLNICDGGEGLPGLNFTPEHRAKIAAALRAGNLFSCEICDKQFWRKPKEIKLGNCRFCSRACYAKSLKNVPRAVPSETTRRGIVAAAKARRSKTHCKRGHPLSGENLFINHAGSRGCKECRKIHKSNYRSKFHG